MLLFMTCRVLLALWLLIPERSAETETQKKRSQPPKRVKIILDSSVMKIPSVNIPHLNKNSLSPWIYRDVYEEDRIPQRLSQAECISSYCQFPHRGEDLGFESKPIAYRTLVLRRIQLPSGLRKRKVGQNIKKKHVFRLESKIITVGCTCVVPSVIQQDHY